MRQLMSLKKGKKMNQLETACGACGEFIEDSKHICVVELDYIADTACEICENHTDQNHANTTFWNWVCENCWSIEKGRI